MLATAVWSISSSTPICLLWNIIPKVRQAKTSREERSGTLTDQQQVRDNGQTRFAFIARQYVLRCESTGKIELPTQKFEVQLGTYVVEEDPYDFFAPSRLRLMQRHRLKIKSPQHTLDISERPKRTTREVMRSGQQVI